MLNLLKTWPFTLAFLLALTLPLPAMAGNETLQPANPHLSKTFEAIWRDNLWQHPESRSGPGSTMDATLYVRQGVEKLIADYDIESIVDAACGDFGWMSTVDMQGATYLGLDIVPGLIAQLQQRYSTEDGSRQFHVGDITEGPLPEGDMLIARDVLGHLSYKHGLKALKNVRASGSRWFLSTTFTARQNNTDIVDGQWRPVNLSIWPYNLGKPVAVIHERCMVGGGVVADKSLGLWPIDRLPQ